MSKNKSNAFADAADMMGSAGIDALFLTEGRPQFSDILIDDIDVRAQVRTEFEDKENSLDEMADSIRERGVLQPILVRPTSTGRYELIAGERRYRASKLTGLSSIPAYIREMTDQQAEDAQLAENIQRKNLTQIEEAQKIQRDLDQLGSVEAVLAKHHKSRAWLSKILAVLNLPTQAKRLVSENVSADLEVINTVKQVERLDSEKAKIWVESLKLSRGKVNARVMATKAKDEVKPAKAKKSSKAVKETAHIADALDASIPVRSMGDELDQIYLDLYENRVKASEVTQRLNTKIVGEVTGWLRKNYDEGHGSFNMLQTVVTGLRGGRFAGDGESAFALIAYLQGASNQSFDVERIFAAVEP